MDGKANDFELLQLEMSKLKNSIGSTNEKSNGSSFSWSDLIKVPGRKALIIGIVLAVLNQLCGCFAMLNYTSLIFEKSGSNLSPNFSAIIVSTNFSYHIDLFNFFSYLFYSLLVQILSTRWV